MKENLNMDYLMEYRESSDFYIQKTSHCPFCHNVVVLESDRILCAKGCFHLKIDKEFAAKIKNVDILMESLATFRKAHCNCGGNTMVLATDEEVTGAGVELFCDKCDF